MSLLLPRPEEDRGGGPPQAVEGAQGHLLSAPSVTPCGRATSPVLFGTREEKNA